MNSPFDELTYPANAAPMPQSFIDEWVLPFYMKSLVEQKTEFAAVCARATPEIILQLLREVNWRPRTVAARIIAVYRLFEMQQEMSNIFLKSEVCCVGREYCLALTRFANPEATETLCRYLDYYLPRTDLHYDQTMAMAALLYLDKKQDTRYCQQFGALYKEFSGADWRQSLKWSYAWISNVTRHTEEVEQLVQVARNRA